MTTFHRRHLTLLDLLVVGSRLPEDELAQMAAFGVKGSIEEQAARLFLSPGRRWTLADEDENAVACGGLTRVRPGVVETWFWATPEAWEPKSNLTALVRGIKDETLKGGIHRIETYSLVEREKAHSWYTFCLGMTREATLKSFCVDGRDAALFVATAQETT